MTTSTFQGWNTWKFMGKNAYKCAFVTDIKGGDNFKRLSIPESG